MKGVLCDLWNCPKRQFTDWTHAWVTSLCLPHSPSLVLPVAGVSELLRTWV